MRNSQKKLENHNCSKFIKKPQKICSILNNFFRNKKKFSFWKIKKKNFFGKFLWFHQFHKSFLFSILRFNQKKKQKSEISWSKQVPTWFRNMRDAENTRQSAAICSKTFSQKNPKKRRNPRTQKDIFPISTANVAKNLQKTLKKSQNFTETDRRREKCGFVAMARISALVTFRNVQIFEINFESKSNRYSVSHLTSVFRGQRTPGRRDAEKGWERKNGTLCRCVSVCVNDECGREKFENWANERSQERVAKLDGKGWFLGFEGVGWVSHFFEIFHAGKSSLWVVRDFFFQNYFFASFRC